MHFSLWTWGKLRVQRIFLPPRASPISQWNSQKLTKALAFGELDTGEEVFTTASKQKLAREVVGSSH